MPSAVVHGVVPLLFLLAIRKLDARKIWILWPLTFAPDFDYFFGLHRAAFTNVFVLVPFVVVLLVAWRRGDRGLVEWMAIALAYVVSHFLMDTFTGGIVPFYPVSNYTVCYYADAVIHTTDNAFQWEAGPCSHAGIPQVAEYYPWLSDTDTAIMAFLLPAAILMAAWNAWLMRRPPAPSEAASPGKSK